MTNALTRIALACVVVLSVGAVPVSVAEAASSSPPVAVYVAPGGAASVLYADGSTASTGVDVEAVGSMADFDDDQRLEAPVVDADGNLRLVDTEGETQTLVSGSVAFSKTYLPSGDWDGDGDRAIFYEKTNDDGQLYRVEVGSSPEPVVGPDGDPLATNGPVGVTDYDGDGDRDVVFLGSSSTVKYYDGQSVESTGFSSFGSNNGVGLGAPADFDGDGTPRVPYVTGSNNLALLAADGTKTRVTSDYSGAAKAPVAAADWTGDGRLDILHVGTDGTVHYATLSGDVHGVETSSGGTVSAAVGPGVAAAPESTSPASGPTIRDFEATNPSGRNVSVAFTASDPLADIAVDVTGPEETTLTEADFAESDDGPYQYVATVTVATEGTYTATLTRAENEQGVDGSSGEQDTATVETPATTVTDVTIRDADGNGVVGEGDRVRVTATVESDGEVESVTADATAFGAGSVPLAASGDGYSGRFTVGGVDEGGPSSIRVSATDERGSTDTAASGTLVVDTTPPVADAGTGQTVQVGTTATFDAAGSRDDSEIVDYEWTFGDGADATGVTVSHTYDETGTYTVTLTVTDVAGHTDTDSVTMTVTEEGVTATGTPSAESATPTPTSTTTSPAESSDVENQSGPGDATSGDVTVVPEAGRSVTLSFSNLSANNPVSADFRDLASLEESVAIQGVRFVPERGGNVSMTVEGHTTLPADVPSLSSRAGVTVLDYVRLDHSVANERVHGVAFTLVVPKRQVANATEANTVALYRYRNGTWTPHDATRVGETDRAVTYRVRVPGLSVYGVAVRQPAVQVVEADVSTASLAAGESVTVTAVLENEDQTRRTRRVALRVDGTVTDTMTVSLDPNERRTVTFVYEPPRPGEYEVGVESLQAGTLSVQSSTPRSGAWPWWLLVPGVVALAFVGGYATRRWRDSDVDGPLPDLSERQRETLVAAYESGYFDVPRTTTLDDLAERLDRSEQEVSRQLRGGIETLLSTSLTREEGEEADGEGVDRDRDGESVLEWGLSDTESQREK